MNFHNIQAGFGVGNDTNQVYQLRDKDYQYRAVFVGSEKIWPDYVFGRVDNSFNGIGVDNALKDYTLVNAPLNLGTGVIDETIQPEVDPAGADFDVKIICREYSSWHFLSFRLQIPTELDIIGVRETGQSTNIAATFTTTQTLQYTGVQGDKYDAKIVTVNLDPTGTQTSDECKTYDNSLILYFRVPANYESEYRVREIIFQSYQDEFAVWQTITPWIITIYRQQPNFLYRTLATWLGDSYTKYSNANANYSGWNGTREINWDGTSKTYYMAVAFGISQDGGKNWRWGPPNDHKNAAGKLNILEGNHLANFADYCDLTVTGDNWGTITLGAPLADSYYYVIPININIGKYNNEVNNRLTDANYTINYGWNPTGNTEFSPNPQGGGSPATVNNAIVSSRKLTGVIRVVSSIDLYRYLKIDFKYEKHEFTLGI